MTRITMTINTKFNLPLETFCGEDSLPIFSNVVPEKKKKKKEKFSPNWFSEKRRLIKSKTVKKRRIKVS